MTEIMHKTFKLKKEFQLIDIIIQISRDIEFDDLIFTDDIDNGMKSKTFYMIKCVKYLWRKFNQTEKTLDKFQHDFNERVNSGRFPNPENQEKG